MRRGDYRHREPKKTKKCNKKIDTSSILVTTATVQVIKKGKKKEGDEG